MSAPSPFSISNVINIIEESNDIIYNEKKICYVDVNYINIIDPIKAMEAGLLSTSSSSDLEELNCGVHIVSFTSEPEIVGEELSEPQDEALLDKKAQWKSSKEIPSNPFKIPYNINIISHDDDESALDLQSFISNDDIGEEEEEELCAAFDNPFISEDVRDIDNNTLNTEICEAFGEEEFLDGYDSEGWYFHMAIAE